MTEYGRIHTDGSRSGWQPMLEPCPVPWCGSSDVKARSFDANHRRHWIECGKCNFKTPQMPSRTKVITLWNTRQPTQSDALREALWAMPEPYEYLNKDQLKSIRPYVDALRNWKHRYRAVLQEQSK